MFAAATGLRPSELFALERRDVDRQAGVVYVRRAYANGRLKHTKTPLSTRAVPLQAIALDALERLPPSGNPILFPNSRGGRIDFRSFGRRHWKPAQTKAGIEPLRHLDDLRHTYATFALRAGVSVFAVAGEMWNSNSLTSWLIVCSGLDGETVKLPVGGRAPGWHAGLVVARRQTIRADSLCHDTPPAEEQGVSHQSCR